MIIKSLDDKPIKWPKSDSHDPDCEKYYSIEFRPPVRENSKVYVKGVDFVVSSIENGFYYVCVSGGISDSTEPVFSTTEDEITEDNSVQWVAKPLLSKLKVSDSITSAIWSADTGVVLSDESIVSGIECRVKVTAIPSGVRAFTMTLQYTVLRSDAREEIFNKTLIVPVKEL